MNEGFGAFTGELTGAMYMDAGIQWTLVGHSERRDGFNGQPGESDEVVAIKTLRAIEAGMNVILCIGENVFIFVLRVNLLIY